MRMQIGGGMGDEYMRAPPITIGGGDKDKGKGGILAIVLDALGIHRQVAKGPKKGKGGGDSTPVEDQSTKKQMGNEQDPSGTTAAGTQGAPGFTPMMGAETSPYYSAPPPSISILDDAEQAFSALTPKVGKMGFNLDFGLTQR
jgi:hypothetical protein